MAAVGELEQEYGDRVDFVIVGAEETRARAAELERYHIASRGHGLVAFDQAGEVVVTIAGHAYGKEEVRMAVKQVARE